jgi:hypothetical protein
MLTFGAQLDGKLSRKVVGPYAWYHWERIRGNPARNFRNRLETGPRKSREF